MLLLRHHSLVTLLRTDLSIDPPDARICEDVMGHQEIPYKIDGKSTCYWGYGMALLVDPNVSTPAKPYAPIGEHVLNHKQRPQ